MSLKTKRTIPLVILFLAFVSILVFAIGSYPIISYTIQ